MKLSQIGNTANVSVIYGVIVDEDIFDPPQGVTFVGLLWDGTGPKDISERLIDTIIAFSLSGTEVCVEVRPTDDVDPEYLMTLAGNAGFSISLLPPENEADLDMWLGHCERFAAALLTVPNFTKTLYPVSGYLTYLIMEYFGGATALEPTDAYVRERFFLPTPGAWSDSAKEQMRASMSNTLGGEDELKAYLSAIVNGITQQTFKAGLEWLDDTYGNRSTTRQDTEDQ